MPIRLRPDINTKFHIDLKWWEKNNRDIRVYMRDLLCDECREVFAGQAGEGVVDWVDPQTGAVTQEDALWHTIGTCCSHKPDYITESTPIIDAIFLTFVANGNQPLSVQELYERLDKRPPETILRMLTRGQTYLGLRPVPTDEQ